MTSARRLRSAPGPRTGCSIMSFSTWPMTRRQLRSSPGPKTGCSATHRPPPPSTPPGCDPHPVRGPGAASARWSPARRASGLRSSPGPKTGCSSHSDSHGAAAPELRSSPGPRTGCSDREPPLDGAGRRRTLRSSPGPKTGCSASRDRLRRCAVRCCDPHPVRRPGAAARVVVPLLLDHAVAILTRSEDRVQLVHPRVTLGAVGVAILTRSEDRVQPDLAARSIDCRQLRSSPGPKTGCSDPSDAHDHGRGGVAILTRSEDRVQHVRARGEFRKTLQLRSSPGPKTGCSSHSDSHGAAAPLLRPSLGPRTGCSPPAPGTWERAGCVATLTRSADRVQPDRGRDRDRQGQVAILTRSEDRVQRRSPWTIRACGTWLRSSPGPKTGCSPASSGSPQTQTRLLRSSPGPKTGCSYRCRGGR